MMLGTDVFDEDAAMAELRRLAAGDDQALECPIPIWLSRLVSPAVTRHRADSSRSLRGASVSRMTMGIGWSPPCLR